MSSSIALVSKGKPRWRDALRARRLTCDRTRERAASGIVRAIEAAEAPPQAISSAIPVARTAVLACRWDLTALAERLRAPEPVYAQGVALALALLTDGDSPLYRSGGDLQGAVQMIFSALDGHVG